MELEKTLRKTSQKEGLDIAPSQNFMRVKSEAKPKEEVNLEVEQNSAMFHQFVSSKNNVEVMSLQFEKQKEAIIEEQKKINEKNFEMFNDLNDKIREIKTIMVSEKPTSNTPDIDQKIELQSYMKELLQMLKKYFQEIVVNPENKSNVLTKENFGKVLQLFEKVNLNMNELILKEKDKQNLANENNLSVQEKENMTKNRKSLVQVEELNINLTQELYDLVKLTNQNFKERDFSQEQPIATQGTAQIKAVNSLLEQMISNLNHINEKIQFETFNKSSGSKPDIPTVEKNNLFSQSNLDIL